MARRFPPPWRADKIPGGYVVCDANGQPPVYVYSRNNEDEARQAKVLAKDDGSRERPRLSAVVHPRLSGKSWA